MKTYTAKFILYGKAMRTDVQALSADRARDIIRNKIKFHSVEEKEKLPKSEQDAVDDLMRFFKMKR